MELKIEYLPVTELKPYENNARKHAEADVEAIKKSIEEFGFNDPVAVWHDNEIIEGHGRLLAVMEMEDIEEVPIIRLDDLTDEERRAYMLVHNQLTMNTGFDFSVLDEELENLEIDMSEFGLEHTETAYEEEQKRDGILMEKFIVPPFSILDTRRGEWQERKRTWRKMIGDEGQARDVSVFDGNMRQYVSDAFADASILDPVLSEIICKWFTPKAGSKCFDVFAGDTVFGYVSSYLGHNFTGIELRQEQVDFNNEQCNGLNARYLCDDGRNVLDHIEKESQDLLFSCPPYYDLEVYSGLEEDASNQETYEEFYKILDTAFTNAIQCLQENRCAVIVCGDIRNRKTGEYYRFPDDIKDTFQKNGMVLLNELILIDPVGTARLRASRYMDYRKVAKIHQNVLVFYKGDPQKINTIFPKIEVDYESEDME